MSAIENLRVAGGIRMLTRFFAIWIGVSQNVALWLWYFLSTFKTLIASALMCLVHIHASLRFCAPDTSQATAFLEIAPTFSTICYTCLSYVVFHLFISGSRYGRSKPSSTHA